MPPAELDAAPVPFVADGYVRLNKPAFDEVLVEMGDRPDGPRDVVVLLFLLVHAAFGSKERPNPYEGCVVGTDAGLARLAGLDRKRWVRATDRLVAGGWADRLDPEAPRGYRVRRPVWRWLQDPTMPPRPPGVGAHADPFA